MTVPSLTDSTKPGRITLVGAGPGDPGYITLRGVECLAAANVILYDYLVNPAILRHAGPATELICLGKHGRTRIWSQEEINAELIARARVGQHVVRLKCGDPTIFARLAEELEPVIAAGLSFEIVPGITAALAAGSCAGIPLTHRDFASAVALITGHEQDSKTDSSLDYAALARFPGTLVFYMGVTTVHAWTTSLLAAGKSPDTPAAIVRRCSFPDQSTVLCSLGEVAQRMTTPEKMRPPVIVIVGEVANLAPQYGWFEARPLFGKRILVARPAEQAEALVQPLAALGAEVIVQPAIAIEPLEDWAEVDATLARLAEFDWLVFSSANGVRMFLQRLFATGRDLRVLGGVKLAAIGPGTADELRRFHLVADLLPADEFRAEALAEVLSSAAPGKRFLLIRANRGREVLAEQLTAAGGLIEQVVAYRSLDLPSPPLPCFELMQAGKIDWVIVTSSAIARSLVAMFGDSLHRTKLASISPITSATLRELGFMVAAQATSYTMPGVVEAVRFHHE